MDQISSMFPTDQTDDLFQLSPLPCQQHILQFQQEEIRMTPYLNATDFTTTTTTKKKPEKISKPRKSSLLPTLDDSNEKPNDIGNKKKVIHRDIERQRRQEMAALYRSLRSHLPLEHVKGKRSMSDHMDEAVNYIKHLQRKIQELRDKAEGLKRLSSNSNIITPNVAPQSPETGLKNCVTVKPCWAGVEIVICSDFGEKSGQLPLSGVLKVVMEQGLIVVSCISSEVDESLLYTIESEVSEGMKMDLSGLQQQLTDLINQSS